MREDENRTRVMLKNERKENVCVENGQGRRDDKASKRKRRRERSELLYRENRMGPTDELTGSR